MTIKRTRFLLFALILTLLAVPWLTSQAAVTIIYFRANPGTEDIILEWQTGSEIDTLGFNLWRGTDCGEASGAQRINANTIGARGGIATGAEYDFTDTDLEPDVLYDYRLEEITLTGGSNCQDDFPLQAALEGSGSSLASPTPGSGGGGSTPIPTSTTAPTNTPVPTDTPAPTDTPLPPGQPSLTPSATTPPTETSVATQEPTNTATPAGATTNNPTETLEPKPEATTDDFIESDPPEAPGLIGTPETAPTAAPTRQTTTPEEEIAEVAPDDTPTDNGVPQTIGEGEETANEALIEESATESEQVEPGGTSVFIYVLLAFGLLIILGGLGVTAWLVASKRSHKEQS